MNFESNETIVIDEIDRLLVAYEKAREYINKIAVGLEQQSNLWQSRRAIINDQASSSSFRFLLPKAQRINELSIETVQTLCRAELLIEQILRIDPKALQARPGVAQPPSHASISTVNPIASHTQQTASTFKHEQNQLAKISPQILYPSLRRKGLSPQDEQITTSGRVSVTNSQEYGLFKPIEQHKPSVPIDTLRIKSQLYHPRPDSRLNSDTMSQTSNLSRISSILMPQPEHLHSPIKANQSTVRYQHSLPNEKVKVILQRIPQGTRWARAKIEVVDSLSAFYVENLDHEVHAKFDRMCNAINRHYETLEQSKRLVPLNNMSIGDFGVAKYDEDKHWYRARLLMNEENNCIRIVYIDFGNIETKMATELFPLDPVFAELPAQAIACTLSEAYPRNFMEEDFIWPKETIEAFKREVTNKVIEISFVNVQDESLNWPLHFVTIMVGNQTVTNSLALKQLIEPRPNSFIAEQLSSALGQLEYLLFNVNLDNDESISGINN